MQFLSDEWLAAMDEAAGQIDPDVIVGVSLSVDHRAGAEMWRLTIADGRITVGRPTDEPAHVRLTSSTETAVAIACGRQSALDAFMIGDLTLGGDIQRLIAVQRELTAIDDVFAGVRTRTSYPDV